jgi:hypothetical protein
LYDSCRWQAALGVAELPRKRFCSVFFCFEFFNGYLILKGCGFVGRDEIYNFFK